MRVAGCGLVASRGILGDSCCNDYRCHKYRCNLRANRGLGTDFAGPCNLRAGLRVGTGFAVCPKFGRPPPGRLDGPVAQKQKNRIFRTPKRSSAVKGSRIAPDGSVAMVVPAYPRTSILGAFTGFSENLRGQMGPAYSTWARRSGAGPASRGLRGAG